MAKKTTTITVYEDDARDFLKLCALRETDQEEMFETFMVNYFTDQCKVEGVTQEDLDEVEEY